MKLLGALLVHYYVVMFAFDARPARLADSHVWATFVKVEDHKIIDETTISWSPTRPLAPYGDPVPGKNLSLAETIAAAGDREISYWEPLEIEPALFEAARARAEELGNTITDVTFFTAEGADGAMSATAAANVREARDFGLLAGKPAAKVVLEHYGLSVIEPLVTHPEILDSLPKFKGSRQETWKLKMRTH